MRHLEHRLYHLLPFLGHRAIVLLPFVLLALILAKRYRRRRRGHRSSVYDAYIHSPEWHKRRERALKRAGYQCEHRGILGRCSARRGLQVHHLRYYDRHGTILGRERDDDLKVLCRPHHVRADVKRRRRTIRR